ncbi:hypothetical protein CRYUN_Cryun08bG0129800 [Craigia yunnanensis]
MENTNTLAATYSSRKVDRFSNLQDNVYDLIFSFLGVLDVMNLSICSKRLPDLCYSAESLTIESFGNADSYNRFLINRGDSSNYFDRFGYDISTWIRYAVRCNVEDLYIQLTGTTYSRITRYRFPSCLFSCRTLRNMTIYMDDGTLEFPSATACIHLRSLVLKGIRIYGKNKSSFANFLSSFCNLKDLWIENISGMRSIKVKSSSLESFSFLNVETRDDDVCNLSISGDHLQRLRLNCNCNFKGEGSLEIDAPNVKDFEWEGSVAHRFCLKGFEQLDVAKIFLAHDRISSNNLYEVVRSFSRSKHLHLFISLAKDLFEHGFLPIALDTTQKLILHINKKLNYCRTLAIGHFLEGTPNLKTLQIKSSVKFLKKNVHGVDVKFWESQNLAFIYQLEIVEIELLNGVTELELARFFLKHVKELKKMVIFHNSSLPANVILELNEFKNMAYSDRVVFKVK